MASARGFSWSTLRCLRASAICATFRVTSSLSLPIRRRSGPSADARTSRWPTCRRDWRAADCFAPPVSCRARDSARCAGVRRSVSATTSCGSSARRHRADGGARPFGAAPQDSPSRQAADQERRRLSRTDRARRDAREASPGRALRRRHAARPVGAHRRDLSIDDATIIGHAAATKRVLVIADAYNLPRTRGSPRIRCSTSDSAIVAGRC